VIATKVFGGGMFTSLMHDTFLLQMTLSFLQPDDMLFMGVKSIEELNRNMNVIDEYNTNEKYPIMESHCNGCQMCDEACANINHYPLSKWIRYCRYLDSEDPHYIDWAVQKIKQENIEMNCLQCKRCEDICPTKLKIKRYIQDRVNKIATIK
jgi:NAD-dependent dihydropyrimidine dehydrogenase PreA subunit